MPRLPCGAEAAIAAARGGCSPSPKRRASRRLNLWARRRPAAAAPTACRFQRAAGGALRAAQLPGLVLLTDHARQHVDLLAYLLQRQILRPCCSMILTDAMALLYRSHYAFSDAHRLRNAAGTWNVPPPSSLVLKPGHSHLTRVAVQPGLLPSLPASPASSCFRTLLHTCSPACRRGHHRALWLPQHAAQPAGAVAATHPLCGGAGRSRQDIPVCQLPRLCSRPIPAWPAGLANTPASPLRQPCCSPLPDDPPGCVFA